MDRGEYVPDDLVVRMVMDRLDEPDAEKGFILDGFPRTVPQAKALERALERAERPLDRGAEVRDLRRDGRPAALEPVDVPGLQAHLQHGVQAAGRRPGLRRRRRQLERRADDDELTVRRRLAVYQEQTEPLEDFYAERGLLREIDAEAPRGRGHRADDRARWRSVDMIIRKSPESCEKMRRAGRIVAGAIEAVLSAVRPGVTTADLDAVAETYIRDAGALPSFKGYRGTYPATICASIERRDRPRHPLDRRACCAEGELLSLDFGAIWEGFHARLGRDGVRRRRRAVARRRRGW